MNWRKVIQNRKLKAAWLAGPLLAVGLLPAAQAFDACALYLCLSGNWKAIPMCVPIVHEAMRDLAHGKAWPTCESSGEGNNNALVRVFAPQCPPFYSEYDDNGHWISCKYPWMVTTWIDGEWWSDTYVDFQGNTSTHYSDNSKTQLNGDIDPTYDIDAWNYSNPPPPPPDDDRGS